MARYCCGMHNSLLEKLWVSLHVRSGSGTFRKHGGQGLDKLGVKTNAVLAAVIQSIINNTITKQNCTGAMPQVVFHKKTGVTLRQTSRFFFQKVNVFRNTVCTATAQPEAKQPCRWIAKILSCIEIYNMSYLVLYVCRFQFNVVPGVLFF